MEGHNDGVLARRVGRRDFLRYSAILGAAGVLAACKKAETVGGGASGSPRPPVSQEPGTLQIFDWAGYEVKPLWRPYAAQFPGQTPHWTTYKDDQFGYSKIAANPDAADFDIVHPCHYFWSDYVKITKSDGSPVLQPWDTSLITNFTQMNPAFIPDGQFNGQQYFVPVDWGFAAPLYRSDKVHPTEDSWGLLWDDRYEGKITWWDSFDMFIPAAYYKGIADPWNMTDDELRARRSARIRRNRSRRRFLATAATHAGRESMCRPRSVSSHALPSASWTASSAAGRLPLMSAKAFTSRA